MCCSVSRPCAAPVVGSMSTAPAGLARVPAGSLEERARVAQTFLSKIGSCCDSAVMTRLPSGTFRTTKLRSDVRR